MRRENGAGWEVTGLSRAEPVPARNAGQDRRRPPSTPLGTE